MNLRLNALKQQAKDAGLLLPFTFVVLLLILSVDFMQRLWVGRDSGSSKPFDPVTELPLKPFLPLYSSDMRQWLVQAKTLTEQSGDGSSASASTTSALPGAFQLTTLRVRVRAVFIKQQPAVALALAELQTLKDGKVQLQRLEQGSEVDGYRVLSIQKGLVVFGSNSDANQQLSVPVFKGENP